ncbi:MAG: hypothetical protein VXW38_03100 [Bacteroidota bacterium]|nr:hypothetical protein [Bacteroidota bacterium]
MVRIIKNQSFFKGIVLLVALSALLTNIGCLDLRTCQNDIFGKYVCYNDSGAVNYLLLKDDGSFLHYYKKNQTILTDSGRFKRSKKNNCILELSNWKSFNEKGESFDNFINGLLWIDGKYLDIGPDGNSNTSFKKED